MYFGTGAPILTFYRETGALFDAIQLPQPQSRGKNPYKTEHDILKNVLGKMVRHKEYYRFRDRIVWVNLEDAYVDWLIRASMWQGAIFIKPYSDGWIIEPVLVTDIITGSHNGNINYSDMEIEFTGINRRTTIPRDPDYVYTVWGGTAARHSIA